MITLAVDPGPCPPGVFWYVICAFSFSWFDDFTDQQKWFVHPMRRNLVSDGAVEPGAAYRDELFRSPVPARAASIRCAWVGPVQGLWIAIDQCPRPPVLSSRPLCECIDALAH